MGVSIKITKTEQSRLATVDFNNIPFGRVFSDHMFVADYYGGAWHDARIVPFAPISIHPATSALHYGQSIFEGLKAYHAVDGTAQMFRPMNNWARLNRSASRMAMPEVPEELFKEGLTQLLELDQAWVPNTPGSSLYIRPFMFATDEYVGIKASDNYKLIIFTCPVHSYYSAPVKVLISDKFVRAFPGGTGAAKTSGNYAATLMPVQEARSLGYDQMLWTDGIENKYLQEIGTMNVFVQIGDKVITPNLSGTILEGITRDSVITLLKEQGVVVEEREITVDELLEAQSTGTLKDIFGSGTAATISHISHFGYKGKQYTLPPVEERAISYKVGKQLNDIKLGKTEDIYHWMYKVQAPVTVK